MKSKKQYSWKAIIFLGTYHLLLLVLLPYYLWSSSASLGLWAGFLTLYILTGLSITAGYHRLYSHRSYRVNNVVEVFLLFFGSMAFQNSALKWAYDHRRHHAFVDQEEDPYSIKKGFWYAHWLWIFNKDKGIQQPKLIPDMYSNKLVMFQYRHYLAIAWGTNILSVVFFGWLCNDYFGAFVLCFLLRLFFVHHSTWFINSLAHYIGEKPYSRELSAVDNYFLALLTFGEGYHNFHHTFANDYRNGIRWYHFDPTKWLIWSLNKVGLADRLKCTNPLVIEKRMIIADKAMLLEQIKELPVTIQERLDITIHEISERLVATLLQFNQFKDEYIQSKKNRVSRDIKKELHQQLEIVKASLRQDWQHWIELSKEIQQLSALPA